MFDQYFSAMSQVDDSDSVASVFPSVQVAMIVNFSLQKKHRPESGGQ